MKAKILSFQDLDAWQKAKTLVINVYKLTKDFPKEELFGLTNQIRRASTSIPSNIAESFGRKGTKEKIQFFHLARGSVQELKSHFELSKELKYLSKENYLLLFKLANEVDKLLMGLIKSTPKLTKPKANLYLFLISYFLILNIIQCPTF
jgi:four helix bundle protein